LATDIVPRDAQPNVVTILSLMQLIGMVVSAIAFGAFLADFSQIKLIQLVQGMAAATLVINLVAAWKQEPRQPELTIGRSAGDPGFKESLNLLRKAGPWDRRLLAAALGTAAFGMQDVLLEPYGGQILSLSVAATTALTALFATGAVLGFLRAAPLLGRGMHAQRVASAGAMVGISGFVMVIFAAPLESTLIFAAGTAAIGFGAGLFAHATLTGCMQAAPEDQIGGMSDRRILPHWRDSFCCVLVAYDRQQSTMGQQKPGFSWWRMTRGARHRRGPDQPGPVPLG